MKVTLENNGNDMDFAYYHFWPTIFLGDGYSIDGDNQIAGGREGSQEDGTLLWALHRTLEKVTIFFEAKTWSIFSPILFSLFLWLE